MVLVANPAKCSGDAMQKCKGGHERSALTGELFTSSSAISICMIIQRKNIVKLERISHPLPLSKGEGKVKVKNNILEQNR